MCAEKGYVQPKKYALKDGRGLLVSSVLMYPGRYGHAVIAATKDTHGALTLCEEGAHLLCKVMNTTRSGLDRLEVIEA